MKKLKAFTLSESLLALVVLALSAYIFLGMGQVAGKLENRWKNVDEKNWYLFLEQMDEEFRFSRNFQVLEDGRVLQYEYKAIEGQSGEFGLRYNENFQTITRFRVGSGGHMPSLVNVANFQFAKVGNQIKLNVQFIKGKSYTAYFTAGE